MNSLVEELLRENHNETHINKFNHEDLKDHLGLGAIFMSKDRSKILLIDHVKFNFFTIPIGKVKPEETIDEALNIEMSEELGVKLIRYHSVDINTNTYERPGGPINVTQHIFMIDSYTGSIQNLEDDKHRSIEWYDLHKALKMNLSDNTRRMILGIISGKIK